MSVVKQSDSTDLNLLVQSNQQLCKITKALTDTMKNETDSELLFAQYKTQFERLSDYKLQSLDHLQRYGIISLQNSVNFCNGKLDDLPKSDAEILSSNISEAYLSLAVFAQNRGIGFEKHFICSVMKAMKLGSLPAVHLFPCLLDVDGLENEYKEVFVSEVIWF